jgi:2-keto-4-pentenoate hydratase/2-oxohepta-3-ene-1,7-dioic acid hydratase in catechol pathway
MDYVFGYLNLIDGSARGLPPSSNTYYQMKSRDTFCPLGPLLVTADEIPDPHALQVRLWVNGVLKQDYSTSDMAHRIPECLEWITAIHTLEPGDVVTLGTNHGGLGAFQHGDVVEMETAGLGRLRIHVHDPLERTWERDTRKQRRERGLSGSSPQVGGKYAPAAPA